MNSIEYNKISYIVNQVSDKTLNDIFTAMQNAINTRNFAVLDDLGVQFWQAYAVRQQRESQAASLMLVARKKPVDVGVYNISYAPYHRVGIYNIVGPNLMRGFKASEMKTFLLAQGII